MSMIFEGINLSIKIAIIAGALIVGLLSQVFIFKKPDNPVEQLAEEVIKDQTGVTIDLSPEEPKKEGGDGNSK